MAIKTQKRLLAMLGLSAILFCGSTIGSIYAMTSTSVTNNFETGIVDIHLEEYQLNNGKEEQWEDKEYILPGDEISKIPRITNDGNDCYVRASITIYGEDGLEATYLRDIEICGITDKWIFADDGYYYYTEVLPHGNSVDIFQSVKIPENISGEAMGKKFYIDVDVDAIQSRNFTPQYDTTSPWGSIEILECEKEGMYDVNTFKQSDSQNFQIIYQGESQQFIKNKEDFFLNFPYMMPGDTYRETALIENDSENDIKLYFRSEAIDSSELLDKISLKITTEIDGITKVVYDGTLRATELSNDVVLGTIPDNAVGEFHFELNVPAELNNKYTILDSYVKWIFSTEPIIDTELDNGDAPHTGDTFHIGFYMSIVGIALSLCLGGIAIFGLKQEKEEKE